MRRFFAIAMLIAGCGGAPSAPTLPDAPPAAPVNTLPATAAEAVEAIAAAYWDEQMRHSPTWRTYLGERGPHDAELGDPSPAERQRHYTVLAGLEAGLARLDLSTLDARERVVADALRAALRSDLDATVCEPWRWQVDQLAGPQVWFAELPGYHVVDDEARARGLVSRYRQVGPYFEQVVVGLREGLRAGYVAPRINVERVIAQLSAQLEVPVTESPYVATVRKRQVEGAAPPYPDFFAELGAAVEASVYPGLRAYLAFLKDELLPKARDAVGMSAMPHGEACYAAMIRSHTGLERSAEEIHRIGLDEVARINAEMDALAVKLGHPDGAAALEALAKRPDQRLDSAEALLAYNRELLARAQAALPQAFGRLPRTPVALRAIEPFRERDAPAAYYYSAPNDGSRPAYYYLNTWQPATRLLYKMPALAFHEAVPGHHLQIALAAENAELPEFLRNSGQTAFVEGWALYAERLADELGLYRDDVERLGALTYEIWRAARLVVDTGLHARGWTREASIAYLAKQTGHDHGEVVNEIDRYIIWPGQALAYKLGQIEISALRAELEQKLGPRFDRKAFHDHLLTFGALPLPVVRRHVEAAMGVAAGGEPR